MHGIFIMAAVTTLVTLLIICGIIYKRSAKTDHKYLILAFLLGIPAFWMAFYLFRIPLDKILQPLLLENYESIYKTITTFYAPVTEELFKLAVIAVPFYFLHKVTRKNFHFFAFAAGLGFGIGEIWFLANSFSTIPELSTIPWYGFTGFLIERFFVTFLHGSLLLVTLHYLLDSKVRGLVYAMLIHWAINIPIFIGVIFGLQENIYWQGFLSQWVVILSLIMVSVTAKIIMGKAKVGKFLLGEATCPSCNKVFDRSIFGLNFVTKRYERCPHCKKWQWISMLPSK